MELYIEKDFLDSFYIEYDFENPNPIQKIVATIFKEYGDKNVFINYKVENPNELERLMQNNIFFGHLSRENRAPFEVEDIQSHLFKNSKFQQTIIFMSNSQDWFIEASKKGAFCFSFGDYENKIEEIIKNLHFRKDLTEGFGGWGFLIGYEKLSFNELIIMDGYTFVDKKNQKMEDNIFPMLNQIIGQKVDETKTVKFLTKEFNVGIDPRKEPLLYDKNVDKKISVTLRKLNSHFAKSNARFKIIRNDLKRYEFDFHDRRVLSNFSLLTIGKGFNIMPIYRKSDSEIVSETIFDKYIYKRLRNLKNMVLDYEKQL